MYHQTLIIHQAWIQIILPQTQFIIPSHNLTFLILKPQMNSQIPSLAHPLFPTPLSTTPYHIPNEPSSAPSSYTDATPITSDPPDPPSPVDEELENELDSFVTLEQHLQNPNTLKIHHLSQTITSSESSNQASTTEETRAHRVIKRKHPNTPIFPNSRPPQTFSVHPLHTNKK